MKIEFLLKIHTFNNKKSLQLSIFKCYIQNKILLAGLNILELRKGSETCVGDPTTLKEI